MRLQGCQKLSLAFRSGCETETVESQSRYADFIPAIVEACCGDSAAGSGAGKYRKALSTRGRKAHAGLRRNPACLALCGASNEGRPLVHGPAPDAGSAVCRAGKTLHHSTGTDGCRMHCSIQGPISGFSSSGHVRRKGRAMKILASICTLFLLLMWWPSPTHLDTPAVMFLNETPMPWTPIHMVLTAAEVVCVAGLWVLAFRSKRQDKTTA